MSGVVPQFPKFQFTSATGAPLANGTVTVYEAGTTTLANTWQDEDLTVLNQNPIDLDSRGECLIYLDPQQTYKFVLKNAGGATQWTQDDISGATLSRAPFLQAGAGAVARTAQGKMRDIVSVKDFGAAGDGVADDTAAFAAALAASKQVYAPDGTYLVDTVAIPAGNGYNLTGQSTTGTIIKARTSATTKLLQIDGNGSYRTHNAISCLTLDMANMTNASTSYGLYLKDTYDNRVEGVRVINNGASTRTLRCDDGAYTTTFLNCDFGSTTGIIEFVGVSLSDAVTTLTLIGCSFGQCRARYVVAMTFLQPIVQGALNKFDLDEVAGLSILSGDIEGTGTYLVLGANVNHITVAGNELSGFTGTFSSGSMKSGSITDYFGGQGFQWKPIADATITGVLNEVRSAAAITRKLQENTNATSQTVDHQFKNVNGSTYIGQTAAGDTVIDNRGTGKATLQQSGTDRLGVSSGNLLVFGTNTATTATAGTNGAPPAQVKGYLRFVNSSGTEIGKIPYYEL